MYGACIHCENTLTKDNLCASRIVRKSPVCDDCRRKQDTNGRMLARIDVFGHYGGKCACCGETEVMFLTIDHIEKRAGKIEREKNPSMVGLTLMKWLRKNEYPEGYRVLCWNCNLCSGLRGYCPHDASASGLIVETRFTRYRDKLKRELIEAYGGPFCACCSENRLEFLTLDHVNGDGSKHRQVVKLFGQTLYHYLRKEGFPDKERYRILCVNCNSCIGAYGFCPHPQMREVSNG